MHITPTSKFLTITRGEVKELRQGAGRILGIGQMFYFYLMPLAQRS